MLQMLINLISNALKFTPEDGKITVSAFMREDGGMTVQVRDTGIGMAPEDIPRALQAFTQVDDNLSRRHEGTGLGLAIVKSMMEQHGGQLDLQSAKGEGTTVSLVFPAARVLAAKPEMADGHAA
jgi:two-component system cell cycle sensor histidine kinase PleC